MAKFLFIGHQFSVVRGNSGVFLYIPCLWDIKHLVEKKEIRILCYNLKKNIMKKSLSTLLILLFMGVSFTGCEKIKSLADVKFDVDLEAVLDIVVPNEGQLKSSDVAFHFEDEKSINPRDNQDIYDYWDDIKDWAVEGIQLEVLNDGGMSVELTNVKVTIAISKTNTAVFNVGTWTISEGATYELTDEDDNYNKIVNMLDAGQSFNVKFEGDCHLPGYHFIINYIQTVEVTANPLEE